MSEVTIFLIFVAIFVLYIIFKIVFFGVKTAYNGAFGAQKNTEELQSIIILCKSLITDYITRNFDIQKKDDIEYLDIFSFNVFREVNAFAINHSGQDIMNNQFYISTITRHVWDEMAKYTTAENIRLVIKKQQKAHEKHDNYIREIGSRYKDEFRS